MTTVFDVATTLIEQSGNTSMSTVKLQKLCFYTFGWYAHLTGDSLFPETFYAMKKGPVVGELLSAHAKSSKVTASGLGHQFSVRDEEPTPLLPYPKAVLDAVLDYYGKFDPWQLVDKTHEEQVWVDAWKTRPSDSQRGALPQVDIIAYFLGRPAPPEEVLGLPPRAVSFLTADDEARILAESRPSTGFAAAAKSFIIR
jgi:uncharacterized phage-associated protein